MHKELPVTYIRRQLTAEEAERLRIAICDTPNITGYTTLELQHFQNVIVANTDIDLIGCCISIDLGAKWTEIALLYVFAEYRGQHIGSTLFEMAWDEILNRKRHIYVVSRNPVVISHMKAHDMRFIPFYRLPFPIQLHNLHFIISWYRIKDAFSKSVLSKHLPSFCYGIKTSKLS